MTDTATNPTTNPNPTSTSVNKGLRLTLDNDLRSVLGPVLSHLARYRATPPQAAVLEVERDGNARRVEANQRILDRLDTVTDLRRRYLAERMKRLSVQFEVQNLERDLEFGVGPGSKGAAKRKAFAAELAAKRAQIATIDETMAGLTERYRADDASGLATRQAVDAASRRYNETVEELNGAEAELAAIEVDTDAADRDQKLAAAKAKRDKLARRKSDIGDELTTLRRTAVDQVITDKWDPTGPAWSIDSPVDPVEFDEIRKLAADGVDRLTKRQAELDTEIASAKKQWGDKSGKAVDQALKELHKVIDPETYRKQNKARADAEKKANDAKRIAARLAAALDSDIKAAQDKIVAEYKAKTKSPTGPKAKTKSPTGPKAKLEPEAEIVRGLPPAQVRQMAKRMQAAEDRLVNAAATAAKKADKLTRAALDANPDLQVVDKLDVLRKAIPKEAYDYDLIDSLVASTRLAAMEKSTDKMLAGLTDNLGQLKKPGSKIERGVDLEAGIALEATTAARLRLTALYGLVIGIEHSDDGTYKAKITNSVGIKLGAKLGFDADQTKGIGLASVRADGLIGQERVYKSLGDLLTAERSLIVEAVLKGAGTKTSKGDRSFLRRRQELIVKQRINEASLNTRLRRLGVNGQVKSANYKRVEVTKTDVQGRSETFDALAVFQVVDPLAPNPVGLSIGGGASLKLGHATKQKYKTFSFITEIGDSAALQELHMLKADKGLTRVVVTRSPVSENGASIKRWQTNRHTTGHDATVEHYRQLDSRIASLKAARQEAVDSGGTDAAAEQDDALLAVGADLRTELELLRAEYDSFVDLSREVPKDKANQARRQQREQMMKARGMGKNEVAAYVRSVSLQYAVLRRMCDSANEPFKDGPRSLLRSPKDTYLDAFKDDLQTPRVKMSDREAKRVFGDDAAAQLESVETTELMVNANIAGTLGGKLDKGIRKGSDNLKGKLKVPSLNLSIGYVKEQKFKKGVQGVADTAVSIVLDGNFSLTGSGKDTDTGLVSDNPADDSVLMSNLVAKVLDVRSLKKLGVEKDPALEDEIKKALAATMINGNGTMKIELKRVDGKLRLRRVLSVEERKRKIGGGVSIPTATPLNVAISASVSQNQSKVLSVYHGSNTLSELTNLYRTEKTDGNDQRWNEVKKDSRLLRRLLTEVSNSANKSTVGAKQKGRGVKIERNLASILRDINNGTQMKGADTLQTSTRGRSSNVGVANELVEWLLDLKTSKVDKDRDAADKFIKAWISKSNRLRINKPGTAKHEAAMSELEGLFETVIGRKAALEDSKADDSFIKKRGFSRAFLNEFVASKLFDESKALTAKLTGLEGDASKSLPRSVAALRVRALQLHRTSKSKETRELVEDVMALDYASKTLDDLTKFDDEKDKDEAIGMLGADIDKMLRGHRKARTGSNANQSDDMPKPKVYVNALIEAELEQTSDSKFKLVPVIKKGKAPIVKKNMLETEIDLVRKRMNADAGGSADEALVTGIGDAKMISDHHGNPTIAWQDKYYNPDARKAFFEKQRGKRGAIVYTRRAAKRDLRSHSGKSIGAQLKKLMDAQSRAEQRKRAAEQNRRKSAQQAASLASSQ